MPKEEKPASELPITDSEEDELFARYNITDEEEKRAVRRGAAARELASIASEKRRAKQAPPAELPKEKGRRYSID